MWRTKIVAATILGFAVTSTPAQERTFELAAVEPDAKRGTPVEVRDLSDLLVPIIEKHDIPGMVAGIVVGDQLIAMAAAGVRQRGSPEPVTLNDQFHIGSCTKAMTATLCAILVERGTLRWDMTLANAFPDLAGSKHEDFKPATLAQLLTNRAGVPANLDAGGLWGRLWTAEGSPVEVRRMLLEGVVSQPPAYPPGTKNIYSNAGFAIAGHIAETVTGKPYEDLMQEHIFVPRGMTSCGWGPPGTPGKVDQPRGHRRNGKHVLPSANGADNPPAITPAGRLHCTLSDWARFISLHLRGDQANPNHAPALLKPETFAQLHTPPDSLSDYAFGWSRPIRPWAKGDAADAKGYVLTHGGSNTMWYCVTWVAPERDFAVLVMCNQGERGDRACDEAVWTLIQEQMQKNKP